MVCHKRSARRRDTPTRRNCPPVRDDLTVTGPRRNDRLRRTDARRTRITRGSEPVVLRRTRSAGPHPHVGGAVEGRTEHLVVERIIVAHHRSSEVMRHALHDVEHHVQGGVVVLHHDLERPEQLSRQQLEVLHESREGHLDRRRLESTVFRWNRMTRERDTAEQQLGAVDLHDLGDVGTDLLVGPGHDRSDGEVLQLSTRS